MKSLLGERDRMVAVLSTAQNPKVCEVSVGTPAGEKSCRFGVTSRFCLIFRGFLGVRGTWVLTLVAELYIFS